jgi:hypothetical protein
VELNGILKQAQVTFEEFIAIPIVVRYRVLGFEESGVRSQESGFGIQDSGFRIQDSGFGIQELRFWCTS